MVLFPLSIALSIAAFVDNQENSKVLHISDFSNSDNPERALLVSINQELMKYDFNNNNFKNILNCGFSVIISLTIANYIYLGCIIHEQYSTFL